MQHILELAGAGLVGKEKTRKSTCAATSMGSASSGPSDDSPNQPDGDEIQSQTEDFDAVDLQWAREQARTSTLTRHPETGRRNPAATHKRWYVTESLVKEHGRTMGCPRCSSGIGIHNAECRARMEGILLQQSRMKPAEVGEPRSGHTTTKSVPMELEKPTGPVHHGGSSGSGIQRDDAARTGTTRNRWKRLMSR